MIVHDVKQNSEEWYALRLGIPTSSEFSRIFTPGGKISKQAEGYMDHLLAEWAMGSALQTRETEWMQRGHELEDRAVKSYEFETERETSLVGFVTTDNLMIGTSPDRLVGDDGILEIKCPAPQTHLGYMRRRHIDGDYYSQVQGQLYVTGRKWVDIQSYFPGLPSVIIRVQRDEEYIANLASVLAEFVRLLLEARVDIIERYGDFIGERRMKLEAMRAEVAAQGVDA